MSRIAAVLLLLLVSASGAGAQQANSPSLRIQPTSAALRLVIPAPSAISQKNLERLQFADSTRQPTYWQNGLWMGVGTGVVLGTLLGFSNGGEPAVSTKEKFTNSFLLSGVIGMPLGVIGALIGDTMKR